jgi:hypothetical protein
MKYSRLFIITTALIMIFAYCGKSNGNGDSGETASQSGAKETNALTVVFNSQEDYSPGAFELKKTMAFISGMRYNAVSTAKHVYVAFANYDATLGPYAVDIPKEPGQIVIVVSFKTANKEVPFEQQMETYAKLQVAIGTYKPGWMSEKESFQVHYFVGGESGGPSISGSGATGTATLTTSTPGRVSGSIDFTSPKGSTIKGTFNVKIEKDLWKT